MSLSFSSPHYHGGGVGSVTTGLDKRVSNLEKTSTILGLKVSTLENSSTGEGGLLDQRVSAVEEELVGMLLTDEEQTERLTTVESTTLSYGGRLTTAEGTITSQGTRLTTAEGNITSQGTRLTTAEGTITSQGTRLTTAEGNITSQGTRLTTAEGTITSQGTRLTTAEGNITSQGARLTTVESKTNYITVDAVTNQMIIQPTGDIVLRGGAAQNETRTVLLQDVVYIYGSLGNTNGLFMSFKKIGQVADPTQASDAATKNYVDIANTALSGRLTTAEGTITSQGTRLTAAETTNTTQDSRLTAVETKTNFISLVGNTTQIFAAGDLYLRGGNANDEVASVHVMDILNVQGATNLTYAMTMNNKTIRLLGDPTDPTDATPKNYVDTTATSVYNSAVSTAFYQTRSYANALLPPVQLTDSLVAGTASIYDPRGASLVPFLFSGVTGSLTSKNYSRINVIAAEIIAIPSVKVQFAYGAQASATFKIDMAVTWSSDAKSHQIQFAIQKGSGATLTTIASTTGSSDAAKTNVIRTDLVTTITTLSPSDYITPVWRWVSNNGETLNTKVVTDLTIQIWQI